MTRTWSLQRRLALWFTASICGLFLFGVSFATWQVSDSLRRELDALVEEEFAEMTVECYESPLDLKRFEQLAQALDLEHPGYRLSWRAWVEGEDEPWALAGSPAKVPFLGRDAFAEEVTLAPQDGYRWRRGSMDVTLLEGSTSRPARLTVELLVDGSPRVADLRRTGALFLLVALVGSVVGIVGGVVVSRRVAALLERVARNAELAQLHFDAGSEVPADAPEEIRRVAEAFQASAAEMRAQHARNVLLTAGLAHELRSPLQNMMSTAEVALLRPRGVKEYQTILSSQLQEMEALAMVVDNLVTLTALRGTRHLARQESFDFGVEAGIRLDKERTQAERRGVSLELETTGSLEIEGDREALLLMLRNLVDNAVRWTAPGTEVVVQLDGSGQDLVIAVEDQGPGIPPAERESVFEAFYQGAFPEGARGGYGLGLALAKAAVTTHGGSIHLGEGGRGGTRFTVRLRRAAGVAAAAPSPVP